LFNTSRAGGPLLSQTDLYRSGLLAAEPEPNVEHDPTLRARTLRTGSSLIEKRSWRNPVENGDERPTVGFVCRVELKRRRQEKIVREPPRIVGEQGLCLDSACPNREPKRRGSERDFEHNALAGRRNENGNIGTARLRHAENRIHACSRLTKMRGEQERPVAFDLSHRGSRREGALRTKRAGTPQESHGASQDCNGSLPNPTRMI